MSGALSRRRLLTGGAGIAAAVGLSGCAGGSDPRGRTVLGFLGSEAAATFQPVIDGFERANPGIAVAYTTVPADQLNDVLQLRLSAADSAIDVYTVDQPRVPALSARGFLTDLDPVAGRARDAVLPEQFEISSWEGRLRSLPIWTSTQYLFCNVDMLRKAGAEVPAADPAERWTWEQTLGAGRRAQERAGASAALLLEQTDLYYGIQPLVASLEAGSGITGPDMLTPDIRNDGWVRAMTWYHDLFANGLSPRGIESTQLVTLFTDGKAPFFVGGPWNLGAFAGLDAFQWRAVPQPYFADGVPATPTDSWSWGVNPAAAHPDAARRFVEYASLTTKGNLSTVRKTPLIPSNTAAFTSYVERLDTEATASTENAGTIMRHELEHTAVGRPRSIGYTQFETVMGAAFSDIRNGSEPEARLRRASAELERTWDRLR
ncbi:carbohydrate ABC transporter substrate-binding protein (CUT1 family) [Murinocardiopsis flavida]|uniref:Carbohydrate ABC transporter substrate-binding protein (CUT1 family) n=1 Tax=Murinocardiopsis flavida TaxID=645275 RepID=A0A2P8DFM0_9ACTN|nr:sugar ABC transporter substrate-binding protein [Murinocardiopsis flavida]PSK96012.1 carbohydrate ABC transporter substrate-binding protein (CUT1 family) [Murinocardiopsis flavida]